MKTLGVLLLCLAVANSLPRKRSAEVEIVPLGKQSQPGSIYPGHPDYDEYDGGFGSVTLGRSPFAFPSMRTWPSFTNPFMDRWMWSFQDSMRRMRDQMESMWRNLADNATVVDLNNLPGNTTSETQIIDGNVITRNITTYQSNDHGQNVLIHVQSIDVKPVNASSSALGNETITIEENVPVASTPSTGASSTAAETVSQTPSPSVEASSTDTPAVEIISSHRPGIEISPEHLATHPTPNTRENEISPFETEDVHTNRFRHSEELVDSRDSLEDNDIEDVEVFAKPIPERPIDLSSDINVNRMLSDQAMAGGLVMMDPDAELIDVEDNKPVSPFSSSLTRYPSKEWSEW